jgi:hypothetical protein
MSVNLHLSVKISGYDPGRSDSIKQAVQAVFEDEQIEDEMSPPQEYGEGSARTVTSRSDPDFPVIVSGSYEWIPKVQAMLSKAVAEANGGPCQVQFEGEDADEGADDEEEEEDE